MLTKVQLFLQSRNTFLNFYSPQHAFYHYLNIGGLKKEFFHGGEEMGKGQKVNWSTVTFGWLYMFSVGVRASGVKNPLKAYPMWMIILQDMIEYIY